MKWLVAALVVVTSLALLGGDAAEPDDRDHRVGADESRRAKDYWTRGRMEGAAPQDRRRRGPDVADRPTARHFGGRPEIGVLFYRDKRANDHSCTAVVVPSPQRNLILTAAHCVYAEAYEELVAFAPQYSKGSTPHGVWHVERIRVRSGWRTRHDPDLDFAFATVAPLAGARLEDRVGAIPLATNPSLPARVTVVGYPQRQLDATDTAIECTNTAWRAGRFQMGFDCNGFHNGVSGGPWLLDGAIVGIVGGRDGGGTEHCRSYSPWFDRDVTKLYDAMKATLSES